MRRSVLVAATWESFRSTRWGRVGFGFPGASTAADRLIEEVTTEYSRVIWNYENLGSVQWGLQYAYVWAYPWVAGGGPNSARTNIVFTQLRYNLP